MKVIFLDFDGVLCNHESISAGYKARTAPEQDPYGPHDDCVAALNRIIRQTSAKIVVSSSWRKCRKPLGGMSGLLKRWRVKGEVIDVTPSLGYDYARGNEIQKWLDAYPVESFVILDDDSDMVHLSHRLVRTSNMVGLTEQDADRAIAILNAPPTDLFVDRMIQELTA